MKFAAYKPIDYRPVPFSRRIGQILRLANAYYKSRHFSSAFAGEWDALKRYLDLLQITSGQVVDVAASDGVSQSCTLPLFRSAQWSGLAVEMDPEKFARLAYIYADLENCRLARCRVTPENIIHLLRGNEIATDFEVLNLDIDSYDLFVIDEILKRGFRPMIISMEINEKFPPSLYFTVLYEPSHSWQGDHFFGCSAAAAMQTVVPFGYILASIEFNNAIFIRSDLALGKIEGLPLATAYDRGYRNRPNRTKLFPWNADVDAALDMRPRESLSFFSKHFEKYQGKFELHIHDTMNPT